MAYLGREWQLGYANHPPLAAWLTEAALAIGRGVWAVQLAAQLAMVASLWAAWRLGRAIGLSSGAAVLGAALLECCLYYGFTTAEINNNVALYPFWALAVLFLHRAFTTGATSVWIATGLCIGIGSLAKYSMGILVAVMVAFLVLHPATRRHWRTPGPYLAAAAALAVLAPHLAWAAREHFPALEWAAARTRDPHHRSRWVNAFEFSRDQLPAVLPIAAALLPITGWRWRLRALTPPERVDRAFLLAIVLGPFALQVLLQLALNLKLASMYGSQLWTFTGVLLLFTLRQRPEPIRWRLAAAACVAIGLVWIAASVAYDRAWPYIDGEPMAVHFPGRALAREVDAAWRARHTAPLTALGGEWMLAANAALYSRPRPQVYSGGPYARHPDPSPEDNPWTSDVAFARSGGVLVWSANRQTPDIVDRFCRRFPTLELLDPVSLTWQTGARVPPLRVGMAVVPPASDASIGQSCPRRR